MMPEIWVQMLVGQNREPYLEAAIASVSWADGFAVVNTDPDGYGEENERIVRRHVPREKLRLERLRMPHGAGFDFARARNVSFDLMPDGAFALIVDADDVHWPEMEAECRRIVAEGYDIGTFHFFHHAVYKDLLHSVRHREILFSKDEARFERGVHELMTHPRRRPVLSDVRYNHYGYVRPAREVAARWEFYRKLGSEVHEYDVSQPDKALDAWPEVCQPYWCEHPPAVRGLLAELPEAPERKRGIEPPRVGLVLLTWNDAENLKDCLASLMTTDTPFNLHVIDNGSTDETLTLLDGFRHRLGAAHAFSVIEKPGLSLARALNEGFGFCVERERRHPYDYVGWIHPDMVFEDPTWLTQLVVALDEHPDWVKVGCSESGGDVRPGNSQCYLVRQSALKEVGLFNERFEACGGYEDWEHNARLLRVGEVMLIPGTGVVHRAMSTRARHDNVEAGRRNADLYYELVGAWDPLV